MPNRMFRLAAFYILGVCANICSGLLPPLVGSLSRAFGTKADAIGVGMGAQFVAYVLGGAVVGGLIGRIGVRRACLGGVMIILATSVSNYFADTLGWFICNNLLQGAGMLIVVVSGQVGIATQATGAARARALSLWATTPTLGLALGLLAASRFADGPGWRGAFLLLAAIAAAAVVPILLAVKEQAGSEETPPPRLLALLGEKKVILLSIGVTFAILAINGDVSVWPTHLAKVHGTTPGAIGMISSAAMLAGIAGSLLAATALSMGWTYARVLAAVLAVAAAAAVSIFSGVGGLPTATVAMFAWNVAAGGIFALAFSLLPQLVVNPANIGAATGLLYQFSSLGAILGAPIFLAVAATPHPGASLSVLVLSCLAAMAAFTPVWSGFGPRKLPGATPHQQQAS